MVVVIGAAGLTSAENLTGCLAWHGAPTVFALTFGDSHSECSFEIDSCDT